MNNTDIIPYRIAIKMSKNLFITYKSETRSNIQNHLQKINVTK